MPRFENAPPRKRLGQNFLADPRTAGRLVDAFAPQPGDRIVEIGPGTGALTVLLAQSTARVIGLELDQRLIPALEQKMSAFPAAEIRQANALDADWTALSQELGGPLRVIGNLPYNVGTAIVRKLVACDAIHDTQVVLQLEVAERLLSCPGRKSYGPITVITSLRCRRRKIATLSPSVFRPRPKVRSAAIQLVRLPEPLLSSEEIDGMERWLFRGFGHRRKTLAGNLADRREFVRAFLERNSLPADARAEAVPADVWLSLSRSLSEGPPAKQQAARSDAVAKEVPEPGTDT